MFQQKVYINAVMQKCCGFSDSVRALRPDSRRLKLKISAAAVFIYDLIIQTFCPNVTSPYQDKYFV